MSHKQNDLYFEDLARAKEDLRDAEESYTNAREETSKAHEWEKKMRENYFECIEVLQKLKDKE